MGSGIDRRIMIATAAATLLSSCSRATYSALVRADAEAVAQLREAVRSFAQAHRYKSMPVVDDGSGLYFEGRWSEFSFYEMEPGTFYVTLRHRDEVLFPRDDLVAWLEEFTAAARQIEGVEV